MSSAHAADPRGTRPKKKMSDRRKIDVFFSLVVLARLANRQNVTYWALVSNIASMVRGVGRAAESAFA